MILRFWEEPDWEDTLSKNLVTGIFGAIVSGILYGLRKEFGM
ncbi:hypothetical protein [Orenia marismortui]|nr:hypothetical protein [Orenia marismortui]